MRRLGVCLPPLGAGCQSMQGYPSPPQPLSLFPNGRGTVRVMCLAQEHSRMTLARTRTRTTRSRVQCANKLNKTFSREKQIQTPKGHSNTNQTVLTGIRVTGKLSCALSKAGGGFITTETTNNETQKHCKELFQ